MKCFHECVIVKNLLCMQIREWVESFCKKTGASGQLCFDFMYDKRGGSIFCIEANPRTSTNLMAFYNHPKFAAAYYKPQVCHMAI